MFGDMLRTQPSSSRLQSLINRIKSGDPSEVIPALNELCDVLSVASEDTVNSTIVASLVPLLVNIIADSFSPEVELLGVRAMTNLVSEKSTEFCSFLFPSSLAFH